MDSTRKNQRGGPIASDQSTNQAGSNGSTDWPSVCLGDICELVNGRGFKPHEWKKQGKPIIRIQNLNGSEEFNYFDGEYDPKIEVSPGELLFAWSGSRGASFGPHVWWGPVAVLNYHTWKVVPRNNVEANYLLQFLEYETVLIEAASHGAASLVHVQKQWMERRPMRLPPLDEQRRIAAILRTWDEAIDAAERLVHASLRQLNALRARLFSVSDRVGEPLPFSEFLTESRLPGSDGARARKVTVKLYGKGAIEKSETRGAGSEATRYYTRRAGQLVYSKLDFLNGAFALLPDELDGHETTLDLPAFDIDQRVNSRWLIEYLIRPAYYTAQTALARGQRKARRVSPEDFLASVIRVPDRELQDKIAEVLLEATDKLAACRRHQEALQRQKRGLMQKLFAGEWRASEEEFAIG